MTTVRRVVEAYLDATASRRCALSTFLGGLTTPMTDLDDYWRVRKAVEREMTRRVKAGEVAIVRSVGGRKTFVRTSDLTAQDVVLHWHRRGR